ncbi:MAG TPA: 50S ribosomal protein L10 [Planctomycetes bacterium]|nr:50S ribosomal protein L10 [Planctomycetota bacterium]
MSKYVKKLITEHLRQRLAGVNDALLVNVIGMDANTNHRLRRRLAEKDIHLMVVKNSLAARATADTPLGTMFEGLTGPAAICWGGEDIVSLAKEIIQLAKDEQYSPLEVRGGVMDGERLEPDTVEQISRWPTREEQLAQLAGQLIGPGASLAAQMLGPGGTLAGQIAGQAEGDGQEASQEPEQ